MSFNNDFNNFFPDFSEGNFISPENVKLNEETKKEDIETINIMNDLEEFIDASAIEEFGLDKIDEKTVIDGFKANIFLKLYNDLEKEKNKINDNLISVPLALKCKIDAMTTPSKSVEKLEKLLIKV